ncbi:MAG: ribosome maturation factor RimP, partial [candidate division Zixibacteria bacterium]|nr:ribosome maturation factor RimP [candidate division Zixibacteria bacterium]
GEVIDGTDLFERGYTLEVSSPGLDRPLTTARDFRFRIGETVKIGFVDPKRKAVTAEIISTTGDAVVFRNATGEFTLPLVEIDKAKIVF